MPVNLSSDIRKAIWLMMTDQAFKSAVGSGNLGTEAAKHGLNLTAAEQQALAGIDPSDLASMLSSIENDVSLMMGGSRPRAMIALSDETITELKKTLKDV